jgi:hypothetical protein
MRALRPCIAWMLTVALAACVDPRGSDGASGREPVLTTVAVVNNNHSATVEVYALNMGRTYSLGSVESGDTGKFVLPNPALLRGDLELRARPTGLRVAQSTGPISFEHGETIDFTVEQLSDLSHVSVH